MGKIRGLLSFEEKKNPVTQGRRANSNSPSKTRIRLSPSAAGAGGVTRHDLRLEEIQGRNHSTNTFQPCTDRRQKNSARGTTRQREEEKSTEGMKRRRAIPSPGEGGEKRGKASDDFRGIRRKTTSRRDDTRDPSLEGRRGHRNTGSCRYWIQKGGSSASVGAQSEKKKEKEGAHHHSTQKT